MRGLSTIILIAAAASLLIWIARPIWDEVQKLRAESQDVASALASLSELQKLRDELLATYDAIPKSKLERLREFLPEKSETGALLVTLENLAASGGSRLRQVNFSQTQGRTPLRGAAALKQDEELVESVSYAFNIAASYEVFRAMLLAMEKNLRIVDISDINFSGVGDATDFSLTAKSYYKK